MLLLLVRHAQAAPQDEALYPDDSLRPLIPKGRRIHRRMSRELRRRKLVPTRIFSSPWKRAWQTARILLRETGLPKSARVACPALAEPPDLTALAAEIGPFDPGETIALVGHEPWMSELAARLLTGGAGALSVDFPKSGVLGIELADFSAGSESATLRFFLVP